jgi:uncharacterized membrane protein
MSWFDLALLSTAAFSAAVLVDKILLSCCIRSSTAYLLALVLLQQIFVVLAAAFAGWGFEYPYSLYGLLLGVVQAILYAAYLRALKVEEASRVTSLIFVYPVFVFLGSALLLGEVLSPRHYAGGLIIVASALLVSHRLSGRSLAFLPAFSPALKPLFIFWLCSAIYAIGIKYLSAFIDGWHIFIWSSLGMLFALLPLLAEGSLRAEALEFFRTGPGLLVAIALEEIFDLMGRLLSIFAFASGPVALVSAVGALQPTITLAFILIIGLFMPGPLAEEADKMTLAVKLLAALMVAAGIYLIS